jgi:hypothetical protein
MRLRIEHAGPKSPVHIVWGVIVISAIIAAGFFKGYLNIFPQCVFKHATGIPCLTCGGTRSIILLSQFDIMESVAYNPLAAAAALGLMLFSISVLIGVILRRRMAIEISPSDARIMRIAILTTIMINWAYLILSEF